MTCPRCHSEFDDSGYNDSAFNDSGFNDNGGVCPECGIRLLRSISGVMKTSAVMISARGEHGFYRSVQDVPEPLRTQLIETTTSPNSGIIVIADRAGKEQLTQVMARREAGRDGVRPTPYGSRETAASDSSALPPAGRLPWLAWAGFIAVLALAAILFALFRIDWAILGIHR